MAGKTPASLKLEEGEREALEQLARKHTTPQHIASRARVILLAAQGLNHSEIARELKLSRESTRKWRRRWRNRADAELSVDERLKDALRPGAPPTFTPEQLMHLFAIACEDPQRCGRSISHWTSRELADELIKQGIVDHISARHVGRLLAQADLKPHQVR